MTDEDDVKPEEMAALARGLRRSALRVSDPEVADNSDGREAAAAYHGPAAPPSPAESAEVADDGVLLSATLQRDLDELDRRRLQKDASAARGAVEETVPARSSRRRRASTWVWIGAAMAAGALVVAGVAALGAARDGLPTVAPAGSTPLSSGRPPAVATAAPVAVGVASAGPSAEPVPMAVASSQTDPPAPPASSATVPPRAKPAGRGRPPAHPGASGEGSSEMITPPL